MPHLLTPHLREALDSEFAEDWLRQRRTAEDILQRLEHQEGVVLADQVGMGKTFVALAVATSKILAEPGLGQVVILVPARVGDKWIKEWKKFNNSVLRDRAPELRCVHRAIRSGEDFLRALDDPKDRRSHIVVVTYEALTANMKDPFIQLALLYYATRGRAGAAAIRERIARWSTGNSGLIRDNRLKSEQVETLFSKPPSAWRETWLALTGEELSDDPVPTGLLDVVDEIDLSDLWTVCQSLPVKTSANLDDRLKEARKRLADATQSVWKSVLVSAKLELPLLIVDEAHSLKNNHTRLSRLLTPLDGENQDGAFQDIFDRILLLSATPFELGHDELINVLSRLDAIRPIEPKPAEPLPVRLDRLKESLRRAQVTAVELDTSWGKLSDADVVAFDSWGLTADPPAQLGAHGRKAWRDAQLAVQARREMHVQLKPWVIRHSRASRRKYYEGAAVLPGSESVADRGLEIGDEAALPFLLAARAQAVAEQHPGTSRPLFAYGIASSYAAFRRLGSDDLVLDSDENFDEDEGPDAVDGSRTDSSAAEVSWYRNEIDNRLGKLEQVQVEAGHPKVAATAERALQLWLAGEKCLIFCWYVRTTAALRDVLEDKLDRSIKEIASHALGVRVDQVNDELTRISERLLRADTSNYEQIRRWLHQHFVSVTSDEVLSGSLTDAAIRNLRTPSYLVRFTNLHESLDRNELLDGLTGNNPPAVNLVDRWTAFASRLAHAPDGYQETLDALLGDHVHDGATASGRGASLSPVRRAYGETRRADRERLITVFNTPFAPDILVASSVMGEGIDLHQECRHVIHHDLDWNPSRLEQRTGRLDRIGALAERVNAPIEVFEPYLAGTHDEKMFRVVKDRAAWFDVVLGRSVDPDAPETDAVEVRLPLHERIQEELALDLRSPEFG